MSRPPAAPADMPPVPDDIRAAARQAPDHWLGMVDPAWRGDDSPPQWAVIGQWRSDERGEIVEWQENPEYRPSPGMLGWPDPTDPVDDAVQAAATGYGTLDAVWRTLAVAELRVPVRADGELVTVSTPDGDPVVPVYTSARHLDSVGALGFETLSADEVLDRLPEGHEVYVNPAAPVAMRVAPEHLDGFTVRGAAAGAGGGVPAGAGASAAGAEGDVPAEAATAAPEADTAAGARPPVAGVAPPRPMNTVSTDRTSRDAD